MDGGEMTCTAKFRYRQEDHKVTVKMTGDDEAEVILTGRYAPSRRDKPSFL